MLVNPETSEGSAEPVASRIVFFIRAHNDLDHFAPVIYALLRRAAPVSVVLRDPRHTFSDDFRLEHLRSTYGLVPVSLTSLIGMTRVESRLAAILHRLQRGLLDALSRIQGRAPRAALLKLWARLRGIQVRIHARICERMDAALLLDKVLGPGHGGVIVFDHGVSKEVTRLLDEGRRRGCRSVSLPHGIHHFANLELDYSLLEPRRGSSDFAHLNAFDHIVAPNATHARRLARGGVSPLRLTELGSPRFSPEWVALLRNIFPPNPLPTPGPGKLKVLFLDARPDAKWFWIDEYYRALELLATSERVCLVIKPHTRFELSGLGVAVKGDYEIASDRVPTSQLIDWCDLVVFCATSVIYDALRVRKPAILLKYVHTFDLDLEDTISGWTASSRHTFHQLVARCVADPRRSTYSDEEAAACLAKYVDHGDHDVLEAHASFLLDLASSIAQA